MNSELKELELLRAAWGEENGTVPAALGRLVRRQGRRIRVVAVTGVMAAALFLGGSLWVAIRMESVEFVVLAIGVWILTVGATIVQLQSQAKVWTAESETTEEFLRLSVRRCESSLRGIRFGLWLLLAETVLLSGWHAWYWSSRAASPAAGLWMFALAVPIAFLAGLLYLRSRRREELESLERIKRDMEA